MDHPATQADKAERILAFQERAKSASSGPSGRSSSRRTSPWTTSTRLSMQSGTMARRHPCSFARDFCVYLDVLTIVSLLSSARKRAAPGSRLLASLATHREGISSELATEVANSRRFTAGSEPWRTILPEGEHLELLSGAGWEPDLTVEAAELDDRVEPGRSLLEGRDRQVGMPPCARTPELGAGTPPSGSAVTIKVVIPGSTRNCDIPGLRPSTPRETGLPLVSAHN